MTLACKFVFFGGRAGAAPVYMLAAWLVMVKGQVAGCLVIWRQHAATTPAGKEKEGLAPAGEDIVEEFGGFSSSGEGE